MSVRLMFLLLAAAGAASLLASLALTRIAMSVARRLDFVDRPGGHKSHREPVPYGGGGAVFLAAWLPVVIALIVAAFVSDAWLVDTFGQLARDLVGGARDRVGQALVILIGGVVLFALGLYDDVRPQGPVVKLSVMAAVALFVAWVGEVRIVEDLAGKPASILLTVAWLIVITNAFNFLDNMDGLSAGVASICLAFLMVCGLIAGQVLVPALACVFVGALLGFLFFNFPPARIFMGDAGSLVVGYMIAVVSIMTSYWESGAGHQPFSLAMPLIVLAVPLYDFVSVVVIRLLEGRNPLSGDQRHFSHRLVERGLSRRHAVLTIYLATATTGLGATLLPGADLRITLTVLSMVLLVLLIVAILEAPLRKEP